MPLYNMSSSEITGKCIKNVFFLGGGGGWGFTCDGLSLASHPGGVQVVMFLSYINRDNLG